LLGFADSQHGFSHAYDRFHVLLPMKGFDINATNSLIHLYRGELGRMVSYRIRLDTTTNWSIVTIAGITTLAFGNSEIPHSIFLFAMFLTFFFLNLEARRFRVYEISHRRVRLLEKHFYRDMLESPSDNVWHADLLRDLEQPASPVNWFHAIGWRIRRNYLWLYSGLLLAWLIKIELSPAVEHQLVDLLSRAAIGPIPGWCVVGFVGLVYLSLILWAFATKDHPLVDD
jgi:uncharacterized membrane protein